MLQAKSKNNKTYKNMVAVSNLYQYYWQTLNSLKVPTNKVTNQQYINNYSQIPYGGYMHTMFNNTLLQLVNYTNCEKLWQIAFINNGQLGIFNG